MQPSLFDLPAGDPRPPDQAARDFAVDPVNDVVLEASAGTGKTSVLVDRYVRLIEAGVDPTHILAMTFTRKAAGEMRDRVLAELGRRAGADARMAKQWRTLREHVADIQISTIDAFCFALLREFPLEADVDPGFEVADETEMARFANEALDLTLRATRALIEDDDNVRLLFVRVKLPVLRDALRSLLDRRHVLLPAVAAFVGRHARVTRAPDAAAAFVGRVRELLRAFPDRRAILDDGPAGASEFRWLHADLTSLDLFPIEDAGRVQQLQRRLERYFTRDRHQARAQPARRFTKDDYPSEGARKRHEAAIKVFAPRVLEALDALEADVNGLLARGLLRVLVIAVQKYERLLEDHALLDFAAMLVKSVALLERQEEFARSRLKLQSRYHHVLVDEFQDTSRLQWRLVELLIDAWREGEGPEDAPTSIFVVGDRKQSIYRFRHADVTLLDEAARKIAALRPGRQVRRAISHSFRAVPELLAFVNALSEEMQGDEALAERFRYDDADRFPVSGIAPGARRDGEPVLGVVAEPSVDACAAAVAAEIERLLATAVVRDRSGSRPARPDDIAILFRARAGHQYFEEALEARDIRTYVYKGLGFFDAPEVQDLQALIRYLAKPEADLRAAEVLRSRFVRVSDVGLTRLAPSFAHALRAPEFDVQAAGLDPIDGALVARARASLARWRGLTDRIPPSELLDTVVRESAYAFELRGRRLDQARENVKKVRALVRRVENRGYSTIGRLANYFETLSAGEEANAVIEASGCVHLMTVHAAKGLEFPIVFLVNLHMQGRGRPPGFSVVDQGPGGEPFVAFHQTGATRLEEQRETEELRRVLYVAVTRARDRLYLAGEVDQKGDKLKRGPRSLASLMPAGLVAVFGLAAVSELSSVEWHSRTGTFALRVCRPSAHPPVVTGSRTRVAPEDEIDLEPVSARQPIVRTASALGPNSLGRDEEVAAQPARPAADRLVGTVVHRLFQRRLDPALTAASLAELVPNLVRPEEWVDVSDPASLATQAADLFLRLRIRDDVAGLLRDGACYYEVPFSFRAPDRPDEIIRGSLDCLVVQPNGRCTILEFKTGAPRPEHDAQVQLYAQALRAGLPNREIEARLVYP